MTAKPLHVLFVDDEQRILQALKRSLYSQRQVWDMQYATSGPEALDIMQSWPCDMVISDIRMPEMDGATLLEEIRRTYPHTVRIVLSGHSERIMAMRAAAAAHRFLSKPSSPDCIPLVARINADLMALPHDNILRTAIAGTSALPSFNSLASMFATSKNGEEKAIQAAAEIIAGDIAMSAKVLQLVCSDFFGIGTQVFAPERAAATLGLELIRELATRGDVLSREVDDPYCRKELPGLTEHSLLVAALARQICIAKNCDGDTVNQAYAAGILHDLGRMFTCRIAQASVETETDKHAQAGAWLLKLWGLPAPITTAVQFHHSPGKSGLSGMGPLAAVHLADIFAHEFSPPAFESSASLDMAYMEETSLLASLEDLRMLCEISVFENLRRDIAAARVKRYCDTSRSE